MIDSRDRGAQIMKRRRADNVAHATRGDHCVHTGAPLARAIKPLGDAHVTAGNVLWTMTHNGSTAQARRWITPAGFEFELQIWTGTRVDGEEDLCWSQLFPSEESLADAAQVKRRQLEASGWLEQIDLSAT
jgi:hypothetical protein